MKTQLLVVLTIAFGVMVGFTACDETRGCMDPKSDNFDSSADKDDGSCISPRLKMIGNFDYWLEYSYLAVINGNSSTDTLYGSGSMQITEGNQDEFDFVVNADGQLVFRGSINRWAISFPQQDINDTLNVIGEGTWYTDETDTATCVFQLESTWQPVPEIRWTRTFRYFLTKRP